MKWTTTAIILAIEVALTSFALPVQAAVIDAVQDKVNAIKNDTNTLKNRTSSIASQATEQLKETVDIRGALDPLFSMRERLAEIGIDPASFLEMIPTEDIKDLIAELQTRRYELQDAMNDPNIERFRTEFVTMLQGVSTIVAERGVIEVSPLQTLVENAPVKLIAILKLVTEDIFGEMKETIALQIENLNELRALGVLNGNPLENSAVSARGDLGNPGSSWVGNRAPAGIVRTLNRTQLAADVDGWAIFCSAWGQALEVPVLAITTFQIRNAKFLSRLNTIEDRMDDKEMAIPFQIHGYVGLTLEPGKNVHHAISDTITKLERRQEILNLTKDYISFLSLSGACDAVGGIL